ncbi:glutamate--cysteine ligase [Candidatus Peregrinibacteria bacterium]|nr:glutamate--cysteine ligase [Candidatus Peregrinibacteria bacterium]
MPWNYKQAVSAFSKGTNYKLLKDSEHALERECLRISPKGELAQTPHPVKLGAALTNPYITTDFCEAQLELVTPVCKSEEAAIKSLTEIHTFINRNVTDEWLWPFSMPCKLPSEKNIPLAQYGRSAPAKKRTLYRLGLSARYNRMMQTVSGTHYNFSFGMKFWEVMRKTFAPKEDKYKFITDSYFKLIRNFLRYGWLNTYLFGAAPVVDKSYFRKRPAVLKRYRWGTLYGEHATSLRMSQFGYYSMVQSQLAISFNDLESYLRDLDHAVSTPSPVYKGLPGINNNILQLPAEHYSRIRPKAITKEKGVKYIEVRAVDINPYEAVGLARDQLCFLHLFVVYCLFKDSPLLTRKEEQVLTANQNKVALYGRKPGLTLGENDREVKMETFAMRLLKEMKVIADLMDKTCKNCSHGKSLQIQMEKVLDPSKTPSGMILKQMFEKKESFAKFGLKLAAQHDKTLRAQSLSPAVEKKLLKASADSYRDLEYLEVKYDALLLDHEDLEVSTQIFIKKAQERGIKVEILDRSENFIRLSKGRRTEYVKQATKTSRDSYITYLIMENKEVSKQVLSENGISVPKGGFFESQEKALAAYGDFSKIKIAVKPTLTNFGIGISFVEPGKPEAYAAAVKEAFKHGETVIVEEFIEGEEYRFLVINYKTLSVLNRIPANVTGDAKHTISQLIDIKNADPKFYKFFNDYTLKKGEAEKAYLKSQGLSMSSVPKKGQRVFTRRNSNVATGGDPIDMTDLIPQKFKEIAERAARTVEARICGVDMVIREDAQGAQSESKNDYSILEINYNPALQMHEFPVAGKPRPAAEAVLDLLGF